MSKKESDGGEPKSKDKLTARERDELLIENFVGLQHAMTNLSIRFGALSDNINRLLQVFEEAARNVSRPEEKDPELSKDMFRKIDSLLDQNKTIAQGLVAMEEKLRTRIEENKERESDFSRDLKPSFVDTYPAPFKEEVLRLPEPGKGPENSLKDSLKESVRPFVREVRPLVSSSELSKEGSSRSEFRPRPKPLPNI